MTAYRDGQRVEQREDPKLARLDEATGCDGRPDMRFVYEGDAVVRKEALK